MYRHLTRIYDSFGMKLREDMLHAWKCVYISIFVRFRPSGTAPKDP